MFGIACFVRNLKFIKNLLPDIGVVANGEILEDITERLDVTRLLIFTSEAGPINNVIKACVDGEWFNNIIKEEVQMETRKKTTSNEGSVFTSDESDDDGATTEEESRNDDDVIFSRKLDRQADDLAGIDLSHSVRKAELIPSKGEKIAAEGRGKGELFTRIDGSFSSMLSKNGSDSISNSSQSVVACSIGSASEKGYGLKLQKGE